MTYASSVGHSLIPFIQVGSAILLALGIFAISTSKKARQGLIAIVTGVFTQLVVDFSTPQLMPVPEGTTLVPSLPLIGIACLVGFVFGLGWHMLKRKLATVKKEDARPPKPDAPNDHE